MTTEKFVQDMLSKTRQALGQDCYYSNDELGVSQFIALAVTRDSELISESNWHSIIRDMDSRELPYSIERFHHWACGWIDYLIIDTSAEESILFIEDALRALDDYPLYDESDYSERESEQTQESLIDCIQSLYWRNEYSIDQDKAIQLTYEIAYDSVDYCGYMDWNKIESALAEYIVSE